MNLIKRRSMGECILELERICFALEENPELTEDVIARLDDLTLTLTDRVDNFIDYRRYIDKMTEALEQRIVEFRRLKSVSENVKKRLDKYVMYLEASTQIPLKGSFQRLAVQKNPESLTVDIPTREVSVRHVLTNTSLIPTDYQKTVTHVIIDTERVKADLKAGFPLSWARLTQDKHVRIR